MKRLLQITAILSLFVVPFSDKILPPQHHPAQIIAASIARHEGWNVPNSLVRRLHNPGALVYARQPGAKKAQSGYARFTDDATGIHALVSDIRVKLRHKMTLRQIAKVWTTGAGYLKDMVKETGINPDITLDE